MKEKIAVIDYRTSEDCRRNLEKYGLTLIDSYNNENVYNAISGHVDINMFTDGEQIIVSPESYSYYKEKFEKCCKNKEISSELGEKIICGKTRLSRKYPGDILYNICYTGKYYIGNFDNTDYEIKKLIYNKFIDEENENPDEDEVEKIRELPEVIHIKQGYSNCSICQVDEESVITYDRGIAEALEKAGLDVLLIETGYINLFEFNYGFIGGASGSIGNDIVFFGDIGKHPDGQRIKDFIEEKGKRAVSLGKDGLTDCGSIFIF